MELWVLSFFSVSALLLSQQDTVLWNQSRAYAINMKCAKRLDTDVSFAYDTACTREKNNHWRINVENCNLGMFP